MSLTDIDTSNINDIKKLKLVYEVSREMGQLQDADLVLQCLLKHTRHYFESDAASVIWLEDDGTQVFRAATGRDADKILGLRLPEGEGLSGWTTKYGECLWVPDVSADARFFAGVDHSTGFRTHSVLTAPIYKKKHIIANLEIVNPSSAMVDKHVYSLLETLTAITAEALNRCDFMSEILKYQKVFESCAEPGLLISQTGNLIDANRAAHTLFHFGTATLSEVHFDDLEISDTSFEELVCKLKNKDAIDWNFIVNGSTSRTYKSSLAPLQAADKSLYYWSAHDITNYVTSEDTRLQLFNMLVHDLRVPLGSIHHSIELVMTAWQENDVTIPVNQVLEIALRSEYRMERLISDILDTTRLNSQTRALKVTSIDIAEMVQDARSIVESSAQRLNHVLTTRLEAAVDYLEGDLDLLQRVLINILGNAVKYTPDGGEIDIVVYDDTNNVYFAVSDNGPGILPSDEDHIFELFFRGTTNRVKGAGIGLAFSKLAVEAHGGKIWLEHKGEKGAKFVFNIPKKLPEHAIFFEE